MSRRIAKALLVAATLVGLSLAAAPRCVGWSLNPFASSDKSESRTYVSVKKSPSALDKITSGTKNLFSKTGEALHLKKPAPKKPPAIVAARPPALSQRQPKSWLTGMFAKKDNRPTSVKDWMGQTKQVTP